MQIQTNLLPRHPFPPRSYPMQCISNDWSNYILLFALFVSALKSTRGILGSLSDLESALGPVLQTDAPVRQLLVAVLFFCPLGMLKSRLVKKSVQNIFFPWTIILWVDPKITYYRTAAKGSGRLMWSGRKTTVMAAVCIFFLSSKVPQTEAGSFCSVFSPEMSLIHLANC